jgi:hypothetical protein
MFYGTLGLIEGLTMERLDRFFDIYGRLTPIWFGDAAAAVFLLSVLALFLL